MFVLVVLRDTLRLPPDEMQPHIKSTLQDHIHAKYANKVTHGKSKEDDQRSGLAYVEWQDAHNLCAGRRCALLLA